MSKPLVGILMGSNSDLPIMEEAAKILKEFDIPYEITISSAHRSPKRTSEYARSAADRGIKVIIAGSRKGVEKRGRSRKGVREKGSEKGSDLFCRKACRKVQKSQKGQKRGRIYFEKYINKYASNGRQQNAWGNYIYGFDLS